VKKSLLCALALILICASVCTGAQAAPVVLKPEDKAYLGETVDISLVIGWKGQLAWWSSNQYGQSPELIVNATTFQHNFYLDPAKFRLGNWYKWDGVYEPSGHNIAFVIEAGVRPEPTKTPGNYTEILITPVPTPTQYQPQQTHIVIAKGDGNTLDYYVSGTTTKAGHIWIFGRAQKIYDEPFTQSEDGTYYTFDFTPHLTGGLDAGWYTGYLQFDGANGLHDVYYNKKENTLDTPFDDSIIKDVPLAGFLPQRVQSEFELLAKNKAYFDDDLVMITMDVKEPTLLFTDYYENVDDIVVKGESSMAEGTTITFVVDPERWATTAEKRAHTTTTTLEGGINEVRKFTVTINVDWSEMAIGGHSVVGTIESNGIKLTQKKDFDVTSVNVNPTQPPEQRKVVVEEYGWHIIDNSTNTATTPVSTPTPEIIYIIQTQPPIIQIVTVYVTPPPTPTPESPIPPFIGIMALIVCAYIVLNKKVK